jgi:hypothetical protein
MIQEIPSFVSNRDNRNLSKKIEEEEVINVIWYLEPYKAPKLDRFTIHFY